MRIIIILSLNNISKMHSHKNAWYKKSTIKVLFISFYFFLRSAYDVEVVVQTVLFVG